MHDILKKPTKHLVSSLIFPEIQKELIANPSLVGSLQGLLVIIVLKNSVEQDEWFVLLRQGQPPKITTTKPENIDGLKVGIVRLEDRTVMKFISGGLTGVNALANGKIKVAGDLEFINELGNVFYAAGGVEKTTAYLKAALKINKAIL